MLASPCHRLDTKTAAYQSVMRPNSCRLSGNCVTGLLESFTEPKEYEMQGCRDRVRRHAAPRPGLWQGPGKTCDVNEVRDLRKFSGFLV